MEENTTTSVWESTATSVWNNDSKDGNGLIDASNGMTNQLPLDFIVAAHAMCFNMTFADYLSSKGYKPEEISTRATVTAEGTGMPNMHLETQGRVPSLNAESFKARADKVGKTCPVCKLMKNNMQVHIDATLK